MKGDALTGTQIREPSLARVPSATSAEIADLAAAVQRVPEAQRADFVPRATVAEQVQKVPLAGRADVVATAPTASRAVSARGTRLLGGRGSGDLQRGHCENGTVKAIITARGRGKNQPEIIDEFMCNGADATLEIFRDVEFGPRPGLYLLHLPGLVDRFGATAIGSAPGLNTIVNVGRFFQFPENFAVRVDSAHGFFQRGEELFTVTVF